MSKNIITAAAVYLFLAMTCHAQSSENTYPNALDKMPESRFDQTLNYPTQIQLYDIKDSELGPMMNSARLQSESASIKEISQSGIAINGVSEATAREKYKNKLVEKLVNDRNLALIKKLNSVPVQPVTQPGIVSGLTAEQIKQTAASIELSPAVDNRESLNSKYNPNNDMGYCFLRAHYYAGAVHQRGLDMGSVRKIFLIGTMKILGANWAPINGWRYHVATTVRGVDGQWYVLDNHLGFFSGKNGYAKRVYTIEQWYKYYEKFMNTTENLSEDVADGGNKESAKAKALFLFITEPDRVVPEGIPYTKETFHGVDQNKNGQLDRNEMTFHGVFVDVDNYVNVAIHECSRERYAPLSPSDEKCRNLTPADQQQFRQRQLLINQWRLEKSFEEEKKMFPTY